MLHTQCPNCLSAYPVDSDLLSRGRGRLRCGSCERDFDALERLSEEPIAHVAPAMPALRQPPRVELEHQPLQRALFDADRPDTAPSVAQPRRSGNGGGSWLTRAWPALLLPLACAVLILQLVLAERGRLSADPRLRPAVAALSDRVGLQVPLWNEPDALRMTARSISRHPIVPGALRVDATFRNDAKFRQAWPTLELRFGDVDGKPLAMRRFAPSEYLGRIPTTTLAPGQSATLSFDLVDPGVDALAFEFRFH